MERVKRVPGSFVARVWVQGLADPEAVQLPLHLSKHGTHREPHVPLLGEVHHPGKDGERGVVDVLDGRAVEDEPAQRPAGLDEGPQVGEQLSRVGVVEAGAEPVDDQPLLRPRAGRDGDRLQVSGRRLHQHVVERVVAVPQVVDDRGDDGDHDAVLDAERDHRGGGEHRDRELVPPQREDAPQLLQVDQLDRDQEDDRGQGGPRQVGERPGEQRGGDKHHGGGGELGELAPPARQVGRAERAQVIGNAQRLVVLRGVGARGRRALRQDDHE